MEIKVRLYSILREKLPPEAGGRATVTLRERATIADLLESMEIERNVVVSVNGEHERDHERQLKPGDLVRLFSSVSGGRAKSNPDDLIEERRASDALRV